MTETQIQSQIIGYLNTRNDLFFQRTNNIAVYDPKTGCHRKTPPGFKNGYPDITLIKNGIFIGLEVKKDDKFKVNCKNGKKGDWKQVQSSDQEDIQFLIEEAGGKYFVVRSVDDVIKVLEEM